MKKGCVFVFQCYSSYADGIENSTTERYEGEFHEHSLSGAKLNRIDTIKANQKSLLMQLFSVQIHPPTNLNQPIACFRHTQPRQLLPSPSG